MDHDDIDLPQFLANRDMPCPVCGYNLRQLTSNQCPECGVQLELQVGSANPQIGYHLAFMAPVVAMAGCAFLFIALSVLKGPPPLRSGFFLIMVVGIVDAFAIWPLYRLRGRFHRYGDRAKIRLIIALWLFHLTIAVIGVVTI